MASVSIVGSSNNIEITLDPSGCSGVQFTTHKLYQNGSFYTSFNTSGNNHTFLNVPVGFNYYVISEIYITGPTLCSSPTSNTITISSFCIPIGQTNIKFSNLASFYGLNVTDITLSGGSNPSIGENIFGKSVLPTTGTISKTRQNAVSELRNTCGGGVDVFAAPVGGDSYFRYYGATLGRIDCGFKVDGQGGLYYILNGNAGSFDSQRPEIRQSNGVTGVETVGSKTIKIGFLTVNLNFPMCVNIQVIRLSDSVVLASSGYFSPTIGSNLITTVTTLSWTNSVNNTNIAVIVNSDSFSDNC